MSYRSGTMVNPGEGKSAWKPGDRVTTDPDSPDFLDLATFKAMLVPGAIEEDAAEAAPKPPGIAELRATYRERTGEEPGRMKKAELIEALAALDDEEDEALEAEPDDEGEDDADSDS